MGKKMRVKAVIFRDYDEYELVPEYWGLTEGATIHDFVAAQNRFNAEAEVEILVGLAGDDDTTLQLTAEVVDLG